MAKSSKNSLQEYNHFLHTKKQCEINCEYCKSEKINQHGPQTFLAYHLNNQPQKQRSKKQNHRRKKNGKITTKKIRNKNSSIYKRNNLKSYQDYLRTSYWKKKRKKALKYYGLKCMICKRSHITLHVHHITYDNLFQEPMKDLMVLCYECHAIKHEDKYGPAGPLWEEYNSIINGVY